MEEMQIGQTFRVRCVEDAGGEDGCERCIFHTDEPLGQCGCNPAGIPFKCNPSSRKDGKFVHFEIVEE